MKMLVSFFDSAFLNSIWSQTTIFMHLQAGFPVQLINNFW